MTNTLKLIAVSLKIADSETVEAVDEAAKMIDSDNSLSLLDLRRRPKDGYAILKYVGKPEHVYNRLLLMIDNILEKIDIKSFMDYSQLSGVISDIVFIPVRNMKLSDCKPWINQLIKKMKDKFEIPVLKFGEVVNFKNIDEIKKIHALSPAKIQQEMNSSKLQSDDEKIDFNSTYGLTLVGNRKFVVIYLIYLDTESLDIAQEIADEIGEQGRIVYDNQGVPLKNSSGEIVRDKGIYQTIETLTYAVEENKMTQIICKLKDYENPTLVQLFDTVQSVSDRYIVNILGSNFLGTIPLDVLNKAIATLPNSEDILQLPMKERLDNLNKYLKMNVFGEFTPEWQVVDFRFLEPNS